MRIQAVEIAQVDGGLRTVSFVKVIGENGQVGWAEFSDLWAFGLLSAVEALAVTLIGSDVDDLTFLRAKLMALAGPVASGVHHRAVAALCNACLDLKARSLDVSVSSLLGGRFRDRVTTYFSHVGMFRADPDTAAVLGVEPLQTLDDLRRLGEEIRDQGFRACKTNPLLPSKEGGFAHRNPGFVPKDWQAERAYDPQLLRDLRATLEAIRDGLGPDVELALDVNYSFTPEAIVRLGRLLEPLGLMWLEADVNDPRTLRYLRDSLPTSLASLETCHGAAEYLPFFEARAVDVAIIDGMWNGVAESVRIAHLAEVFEVGVALHAYTGALATAMSAQLAAAVPNIRIVEYEGDDVAWRDDVLSVPLEVKDGYLMVPSGPGWGVSIDEEVVRARSTLWKTIGG